jgi:hypothetical protein
MKGDDNSKFALIWQFVSTLNKGSFVDWVESLFIFVLYNITLSFVDLI